MKFIVIILLYLSFCIANSAELTPIWHTQSGAGDIQDMEMLKGHDEFILLVGVGSAAELQIRSTVTGELLNSVFVGTSTDSRIAITPDSTRIIHLNGGIAQIRSIDEDFSQVGYFGVDSDSILYRITNTAIDPYRPYAYVTIYGWTGIYPNIITKSKVSMYNYETGKFVKDLTELGDYEYSVIEVSDNGKYLATLNDGKTYLKVWNLVNMELIVNEKLFNENEDIWCTSKDIKFSNVDSNIIYISGLFSEQIDNYRHNGVFTYELFKRKRNRVLPEGLYDGNRFHLIDNETRIFNSSRTRIGVINLNNSEFEIYGLPPEYIYSHKVIYSQASNYFLGFTANNISKFTYDSQTNVEEPNLIESVVSPNPTSGLVNLQLPCVNEPYSYSFIDMSGSKLDQKFISNSSNELQLDLYSFPIGVYYLIIECSSGVTTYKILREG